jgi:hypothetical protein
VHFITYNDTLRRIPLDTGSARRRKLYLLRTNIHKREINIPPAEFEPAVLASEQPQIDALDRAANGIRHIDFTLQLPTDIKLLKDIFTDST